MERALTRVGAALASRVVVPWLATSLALVGCGGAAPSSAEAPRAARAPARYALAFDTSLGHVVETICSDGPWTERVVPMHPEAGARLVGVTIVRGGGSREELDRGELEVARRALSTAHHALAPDDCVELTVALGSSGPSGIVTGSLALEGARAFATSAFWFVAEPWSRAYEPTLTTTLPPGMSLASGLARRTEDGILRLDERAHFFLGYGLVGALREGRVAVPGGCARWATPVNTGLASEALDAWVAAAGRASALLAGISPARDALVVVVPVPRAPSSPPVLFGMAGRGTTPSVLAFVSDPASSELASDWTLTHELVHLAMPWVPSEDAWLSEGLATYFQEVLRARARLIAPEAAWRALVEGFRRGARDGTGRSLRDEARVMRETRAFGRVYWAGAALMLAIDVELRVRGLVPLDARIAALGPRRDERRTAAELVAELDRGEGIVRAIVDAQLDRASFPDLGPTLARLGIATGDAVGDARTLELAPDDATTALRDAVMNARPALASDGACRDPAQLE